MLFTSSWGGNHRMSGAGRNPPGSSSPTPDRNCKFLSYFEVYDSLEKSMNIEVCIVKMTDYLTDICLIHHLELQLANGSILLPEYCKPVNRDGNGDCQCQVGRAAMVKFSRSLTSLILTPDFVAPRKAIHGLQSINCPSLIVNDLIGVTPCIS